MSACTNCNPNKSAMPTEIELEGVKLVRFDSKEPKHKDLIRSLVEQGKVSEFRATSAYEELTIIGRISADWENNKNGMYVVIEEGNENPIGIAGGYYFNSNPEFVSAFLDDVYDEENLVRGVESAIMAKAEKSGIVFGESAEADQFGCEL